jgi:multidrug resistance efflux pump
VDAVPGTGHDGESPLKRRIVLASVALLAAVVSLGFYWTFGGSRESLRLPGIVEIQEVRLGSKVGGRVLKVDVIEGEIVEAGRVLVEFEVPELEAQREQAQARLIAATAEWEKAKYGPRDEEIAAAHAALKEADARREKMLAGPRPEEKEEARSELVKAQADLNWAQVDFERIKGLYQKGSVPRGDYDAAVTTLNRARGHCDAARARSNMLEVGYRKEDKEEAKAQLERAKENYKLLLAGTRKEDKLLARAHLDEAEARLRELQVNLKEAFVKAPEKAVVEVVAVRKGDVVPPNQPIIRVLRANDLWVKVYVPETELGKVRLNQKVEVTIDSYPGRKFEGTVIQVASISEFTPRNVQSADERRHQVFGVKVRVDNREGIFKSGMAAEVLLPLHD